MTKSKSCMNTPCLVLVTFSDEVVKINCPLLSLDRYLLSVVIGDRHIPRGSNVLSFTIAQNVTVTRWVMPAVTMPFLNDSLNSVKFILGKLQCLTQLANVVERNLM